MGIWLNNKTFKVTQKDILNLKIKCFKKIDDNLLQRLPFPLKNCSLEVDLKTENLEQFL